MMHAFTLPTGKHTPQKPETVNKWRVCENTAGEGERKQKTKQKEGQGTVCRRRGTEARAPPTLELTHVTPPTPLPLPSILLLLPFFVSCRERGRGWVQRDRVYAWSTHRIKGGREGSTGEIMRLLQGDLPAAEEGAIGEAGACAQGHECVCHLCHFTQHPHHAVT